MLTHEQAAYLAAFDALLPRIAQDLAQAGMIDAKGERTPAGCSALVTYRAEWVLVRREHLEELRDVAQAAVSKHMRTFAGHPNQLSEMAPTEEAIAHANELLEVK